MLLLCLNYNILCDVIPCVVQALVVIAVKWRVKLSSIAQCSLFSKSKYIVPCDILLATGGI